MNDKNSTPIRTMELPHNGLNLTINVNSFSPARPAPFAQTPDSPGFDDEGDLGEVDFDVVGAEMDCQKTFIESCPFDLDDDEELTSKVFEVMNS